MFSMSTLSSTHCFYRTPEVIADLVSQYLGYDGGALLDPAVGDGSLVKPLAKLRIKRGTIWGIDVNESHILALSEEKLTWNTLLDYRFIAADFLDWKPESVTLQSEGGFFDRIVLNPPFRHRRGMLRKVGLPGAGVDQRYWVSIEAAFLLRAIELLKDNGRLVAVLPVSLIAGETYSWFRDYLLSAGRVRVVHEMPENCFKDIEGRVYVLCFDKGRDGGIVRLRDEFSEECKQLIIPADREVGVRFDFGYVRGTREFNKIKMSSKVEWVRLGELASVHRGKLASPGGKVSGMHSSDRHAGFWWGKPHHSVKSEVGESEIRAGDFLIQRVGRSCASTFGAVIDGIGVSCTDCVIIVRPGIEVEKTELLLAIRTILGLAEIRMLIEKGMGAKYLTGSGLKGLEIPLCAERRRPFPFELYAQAVLDKSFEKMLALEREYRLRLKSGARWQIAY